MVHRGNGLAAAWCAVMPINVSVQITDVDTAIVTGGLEVAMVVRLIGLPLAACVAKDVMVQQMRMQMTEQFITKVAASALLAMRGKAILALGRIVAYDTSGRTTGGHVAEMRRTRRTTRLGADTRGMAVMDAM